MDYEPKIGDFCKCSRGRPGVITHRKTLPWGESWVGIGLDDGTAWASRSPLPMTPVEVVVLSESKIESPGG